MTLELCVMFVFNFKSLHSLLLGDQFTSLKVKKAINSNNKKKKGKLSTFSFSFTFWALTGETLISQRLAADTACCLRTCNSMSRRNDNIALIAKK